MGCLRCDLSFPYRAFPPHNGAPLQQQQMQAPIGILWLTELPSSYSGARESQFPVESYTTKSNHSSCINGGQVDFARRRRLVLVRMVVAPAPVVLLSVLVKIVVFAVWLATLVPIAPVLDIHVVIPSMVVTMIFIVDSHTTGTT